MYGTRLPISVLYVDDEECLLDICQAFLSRSAGIAVDTAPSVDDGLKAMEGKEYDAIISDYEMPGKNGIDFLKILRAREDRTPFLIFTGKGREEIVIDAFESGADYYVQKGGEPKSQFAELAHKVMTAVRRRQNECALETSNSLLKATLEATADGIVVIGADGRITASNNKFLQMWQLAGTGSVPVTEEDLYSLLTLQVTDTEAFVRPISDARSSPGNNSYDIVHCGDGRVFRRFSQAQKVGDRIVGRVWSFRDITGQSRTELELAAANGQLEAASSELKQKYIELEKSTLLLRESEEKYRGVFHADTSPLLLVNRESLSILDINGAALEMYGYDREEILYLTLYTLSADMIQVTGDVVDRTGELLNCFHRKKNGVIFPAEVMASGFMAGGCPVLVISVRDISRTRQIEDALRLANIKLNLLLGITRHDILNKLTALMTYNDILGSRITDPELSGMLGRQQLAMDSIKKQIDFTREYDELGTRSARWQLVDAMSSRSYSQFLQTIEFACETGTLEVYADPMLEKVFYNLFDNASRYGESISRICISYRMSEEDLLIIFEDDGIGIPAEDKERIFSRGFGKNTGLGLFLTREILSITGMSIQETGEYRNGARFEIRVPEGNYRFIKPMANPTNCSRQPVPADESGD